MTDRPLHPNIDHSALPYRPCVGIMLLNGNGMIWIGRRCHNIVEDGANWQMPQGGIDENEEPSQAALRELAEETGTGKAEILAEMTSWHQYDLPTAILGKALGGKYRGQRQKWFALRFLGDDQDFNIHAPPGGHEPEFDSWRWVKSDEILPLTVPFKRDVYKAVLEEFRFYIR